MRKIPVSWLLFIVCVGCAVLKLSDSSSTLATVTPIFTQQVSMLTSTITTTELPLVKIDTTSQISIVSPKIISICPSNQVVKFDELGLAKDLRLLLLPNTVEASPQLPGTPLSLSSEQSSPVQIIDDKLYDFSVSPDHKWIYFSRLGDNSPPSILWISSLDGQQQWPVINLDSENYAGYPSWVSEQEIFIIGSPHKSDIAALDPWEYMPFISVNPFTLKQHPLTYLARAQQDDLFYNGVVNLNGHSLGMYGRLNRVDFIYDYEKDETIPVFSWLNDVEPHDLDLMPPIWVYDDGKFAVTVQRPDGIDLAFNLDIQSAKENKAYADVMKRITLPERFLPSLVLGVIPNKNQIALQQFDFLNPFQGEKWFYVLDYENQTIYDYCFNLYDSIKRVKFSPDGKFIAFSLENYETDLEQDKHYLVILNVENGKITYLKGYTFIDWGVVAP